MPWHKKAMKDVVSCDKPRIGANNLRSGDFRMGQPVRRNGRTPAAEYIGSKELTGGTETSKYPQEKKAIAISSVAASERETAQTYFMYKSVYVVKWGLRDEER